jgi:hypothetical protein
MKRSRRILKKLAGIKCRQCDRYFKDSHHVIGHERSVHNLDTNGSYILGTAMAYPATSTPNISGSSFSQSLNGGSSFDPFPHNPAPLEEDKTEEEKDEEEGWDWNGGSNTGGNIGGGFGGFGGGNSAGGGASSGW